MNRTHLLPHHFCGAWAPTWLMCGLCFQASSGRNPGVGQGWGFSWRLAREGWPVKRVWLLAILRILIAEGHFLFHWSEGNHISHPQGGRGDGTVRRWTLRSEGHRGAWVVEGKGTGNYVSNYGHLTFRKAVFFIHVLCWGSGDTGTSYNIFLDLLATPQLYLFPSPPGVSHKYYEGCIQHSTFTQNLERQSKTQNFFLFNFLFACS